jgi:hypothetical protein
MKGKKKTALLKSVVFVLGLLLFAPFAKAGGECGMHTTNQEANLILQERELRKQMISMMKGGDEGETIYIPVTAHIICDNQGRQCYSEFDLYELMCEVNAYFAPANMYLYLKGDVRYVNDQSLFWTYFQNELYDIIDRHMKASYVDSTLNIYFCNFFPNARGDNLCGAAPFPFMDLQYFNGRPAGVVMNKTCSQKGEKTLPHELGHHFNLLHTFQGSSSNSATFREHVTREVSLRNCETAGDGFCDTEADTLFYRCPYNGTAKDLRGEALRPDETLLMSYYSDECVNRFSPEQLEEIRSVAYSDPRRNLYRFNNQGTPNTTSINGIAVSMQSPANNANVPWNNINFSWRRIADANKYIVAIFDASNGNRIADIATKDTSITFRFDNNSVVGKRYNWRVYPFREGNMCFTPIFTRTFTASQATSVAQNFLDASSLLLFPNPAYGPSEVKLIFNGERTAEASLSIVDMSGRMMMNEVVFLRQGANEIVIPAGNLSSGIYTISLQDYSGIISRKLIVQQ